MRNTTNMIVTQADSAPAVEEPTWAWPGAVVVGVAVFSLLERRLVYSTLATLISVGLMFGLLFLWLVS